MTVGQFGATFFRALGAGTVSAPARRFEMCWQSIGERSSGLAAIPELDGFDINGIRNTQTLGAINVRTAQEKTSFI
jgi:hypothetical protein